MATDIKKPAEAGSKPKLLLLVSDGVWRSRINSTGFTMNLDSVSKVINVHPQFMFWHW